MSLPTNGRHARMVRHRTVPRHEWLLWTVSLAVRFYTREDGGPKSAVLLAALFLVFSVLIGVSR